VANCKYCQKEITWMKEGYKNIPVESDGARHVCEKMTNALKSTRMIERTSLTPEEILQYEQSINAKATKKRG
jgi:hypothetical protein